MKKITLSIPDYAFHHAAAKARREGIDLASYCAAVLADQVAPTGLLVSTVEQALDSKSESRDVDHKFDVARHFPRFPKGSIELAQAFVDEALKLPAPPGYSRVSATRSRRGIAIDPNFVFIEYLMSQGGTVGISASFYGGPARHGNNSIVTKGRGTYGRARIRTKADLAAATPHIRKAYELRFGDID